jgi:glucosamine--fructose-6-phosphate aminotransferase (isomerizing)
MCGIVGGVGKIDFRTYLINGLKSLDYRGYDSAGLAYVLDGEKSIFSRRSVGLRNSTRSLRNSRDASAAIAHTRWATHGVPSDVNAHPQFSMRQNIFLVHNGVIENFKTLKNRLQAKGYVFASETDTEVIADLLEDYYLSTNDPLIAIRKTIASLEGSFACAILIKDHDELYFMKRSSPILIGVGDGANYLASDAVPMVHYTSKFVDVDDDEYGFMTPSEIPSL